uniref:Ig-like domain-containing protein n=1 Tax=Timema bartmani TaxID=61472 RepID=A0A7R9HY78_9NEOP|nr:unnamed protein product [Timema bartmani]
MEDLQFNVEVKEGFGNQINLCRDRGLNPGPPAQKCDTLPLDHQVAWLRVDTQTILTIASHVITKNHRIGVTHSDHRTWYLHIRDVREKDRGWYMCQINTDPMKSQVGYLEVVVPPDILDYPTSTDMVVREGTNVTLRCAATGSPPPTITWRREGGDIIHLARDLEVRRPYHLPLICLLMTLLTPCRNHVLIGSVPPRVALACGHRSSMPPHPPYLPNPPNPLLQIPSVEGAVFNIIRVNRLHMGAYLCIASNGIPPTVSKRIMLIVHFPPMIFIPDQLVGAYERQQITLECYSEAFPKSINYWTREKGEIIAQGSKYEPLLTEDAYKVHMKLTIRSVGPSDFGSYKCVSKNSLGDTDGSIKLYAIPSPPDLNRANTTRANGQPFRKGTPDQDSNLDLPVIGSIVYCKNSALDHAATEVGKADSEFDDNQNPNEIMDLSDPQQVSKHKGE